MFSVQFPKSHRSWLLIPPSFCSWHSQECQKLCALLWVLCCRSHKTCWAILYHLSLGQLLFHPGPHSSCKVCAHPFRPAHVQPASLQHPGDYLLPSPLSLTRSFSSTHEAFCPLFEVLMGNLYTSIQLWKLPGQSPRPMLGFAHIMHSIHACWIHWSIHPFPSISTKCSNCLSYPHTALISRRNTSEPQLPNSLLSLSICFTMLPKLWVSLRSLHRKGGVSKQYILCSNSSIAHDQKRK